MKVADGWDEIAGAIADWVARVPEQPVVRAGQAP
jgi:hypothetical protein